jgi:hypothetical protein
MPRGLNVPNLLIVNVMLFANIRNFVEVEFITL